MSTVFTMKDNSTRFLLKGASEIVVGSCSTMLMNDNEIIEIDEN